MRKSHEWYKSSIYNHPVGYLVIGWVLSVTDPPMCTQYDIHIIAYTSLFRIVNNFHQEVFSDPNVPNGLNRSIDFRAVTLEHDQQLTNYRQEWAERFERDSDRNGLWPFDCLS